MQNACDRYFLPVAHCRGGYPRCPHTTMRAGDLVAVELQSLIGFWKLLGKAGYRIISRRVSIIPPASGTRQGLSSCMKPSFLENSNLTSTVKVFVKLAQSWDEAAWGRG